jgi:hypothetical protein
VSDPCWCTPGERWPHARTYGDICADPRLTGTIDEHGESTDLLTQLAYQIACLGRELELLRPGRPGTYQDVDELERRVERLEDGW